MRSALSRIPRTSHRSLYTIVGCSVVFSTFHYWPPARLQGERNNQDRWPKTRPLIASTEDKNPAKPPDAKKEHGEGTSETPAPVDSKDGDVPLFADEDSAAWASFSSSVATARSSLTSIEWSSLREKITDQVLPEWAQTLPDYMAKLQTEMDMGPNSLAHEIWEEAQDPDLHRDIISEARVRISKDLCSDELAFIRRRKTYTISALSKYLDIPENDINPQDIPTIAVCGSGGGLRALVAGASSYLSAHELVDCATYTAGVSGSCWLQALYFSSIGGRRYDKIIEHLKRRIGVHIAFPPSFLKLLTRAPTNKYLLSGSVEKLKGDPKADFGLVDIYGLLLASRLLVPRTELGVDDRDLKLSNQRSYISDGQNPLPIYAAVRQEIPVEEQKSEDEKAKGKTTIATKEKAKREAWFQWFEFTPYELWCEDFEAGIPSWAIGRRFSGGRSLFHEDGLGLPELGIPFMLGIWGSAFCATLAHYYKEVRPVIKGLAGFGGIDDLIEERNDDLIKLHPVNPGSVPNYVLGLERFLPDTCPKSIFNDGYLELMDAGMCNNLPLYPLLRRGRDVDIVICFDASADIKKENWLSVADDYVKERGVRGWPIGAGWPKAKDESKRELEATNAVTAQQAAGETADARERQRSSPDAAEDASSETQHQDDDQMLGYCNVWVGTNLGKQRGTDDAPSKLLHADSDQELLDPNAGIAVVYFPLLPNPSVQGVDPNTSPYLSTWNFIYTPDEIDKVVELAQANFESGKEQTRRTVRAVYERKKAKRIELEEKGRVRRWRKQIREHGDHFQ